MKITALIVISCFAFSLAENSPALRRIKRSSSVAAHNETNIVLPGLKLITDSDIGQTSSHPEEEKAKGKEKRSVIGDIIAIKNRKIAALKNSAGDRNDEKAVYVSSGEISNVKPTQITDSTKLDRIDFDKEMTSLPDSSSFVSVEPVKQKKNIITYIFGTPEMEGSNIQSSETLPFPFAFAGSGEHDKDLSTSAERNMIYKFSNHDGRRENNNSTMQLTKSNNNNNNDNSQNYDGNNNDNRNLAPETFREDFIGRNRIDVNLKNDITINNNTANNNNSNNTNNSSNPKHIENLFNKHKEIHPVFMSNFACVTKDNGINAHHKTVKDGTRKVHYYDSNLKQKSELVSDFKNSKNNKSDRFTHVSLTKSQQRPIQGQVRIQLSESSPMAFPSVKSSPLDGFLKIAHMLLSGLGHSDGAPFRSQETQFFVNPINTVEIDGTDSTDYPYNTFDGSQAAAGVRSGIAPINAPPALSLPLPLLSPLVLQSQYITGDDHDDSQPLNFIEKAIETVLNGKRIGGVGVGGISATAISDLAGANESGDGEDDFELRCPLHHEDIKRNGNQNHLIQVCSCHLYKKKRTE